MPIAVKLAITAVLVVLVSEIARRSDRAGALIGALPLITTLAMVWLYAENQGSDKIATHAYLTFWYVLPTLPMFLLIPALLWRGVAFPWALGAGVAITMVLFAGYARVMARFGVDLA